MKRKYIKLNDNYSHLSLGNIMSIIKDESKNKSSAIQSEVFCVIFAIPDINESTVNNYSIGSRSIGNDYKQIYLNLEKKYQKDETVFIDIICNIITIINGTIFDLKDITKINENESFQKITTRLYNISKNDFDVPKAKITKFRNLLREKKYYHLFIEMLIFAILEKKQPLYEDERNKNVIEKILENTDISVIDLQNFLILELNEGINFSHSLKILAQNNNPYANYHLAIMEYKGEFTGFPRYDKAFLYLKKAALCNHPASFWMMGNMIIKEKLGKPTKKDYQQAISYFHQAQDLGSIAAINSLGLCYKYGLGVKKDLDNALEYFKEAAKKKYTYAYNNLGNYYESINDQETAFQYYLKGANLYESYAANKVGEYYRKKNDWKKAYQYYELSLESSITETSSWPYYNLAKYFYKNGCIETNTKKNVDKAILFLEKAQNLIEALEELLYIYYEKNDKKKVYYYKNLIENHEKYNMQIKKEIEKILKNLKNKKEIIIP